MDGSSLSGISGLSKREYSEKVRSFVLEHHSEELDAIKANESNKRYRKAMRRLMQKYAAQAVLGRSTGAAPAGHSASSSVSPSAPPAPTPAPAPASGSTAAASSTSSTFASVVAVADSEPEPSRKRPRREEAGAAGAARAHVDPNAHATFFERHRTACFSSPGIIIDLAYAELDDVKAQEALLPQIHRLAGMNKVAWRPSKVTLAGGSPAFLALARSKHAFDTWETKGLVHVDPRPFQDVLPRSELVYLTADSDTVLERLDARKTYVIGGILDRNSRKGQSAARAAELGVATAKFPIAEYHLRNRLTPGRTVITVNQAAAVVLDHFASGSWDFALSRNLPSRLDHAAKAAIRASGREVAAVVAASNGGSWAHLDVRKPPLALVLGGSSGLGLAMGKAFRRAGWSVLAVGRDGDRLARAAAELRAVEAPARGDSAAPAVVLTASEDCSSDVGLAHLAQCLARASAPVRAVAACNGTFAWDDDERLRGDPQLLLAQNSLARCKAAKHFLGRLSDGAVRYVADKEGRGGPVVGGGDGAKNNYGAKNGDGAKKENEDGGDADKSGEEGGDDDKANTETETNTNTNTNTNTRSETKNAEKLAGKDEDEDEAEGEGEGERRVPHSDRDRVPGSGFTLRRLDSVREHDRVRAAALAARTGADARPSLLLCVGSAAGRPDFGATSTASTAGSQKAGEQKAGERMTSGQMVDGERFYVAAMRGVREWMGRMQAAVREDDGVRLRLLEPPLLDTPLTRREFTAGGPGATTSREGKRVAATVDWAAVPSADAYVQAWCDAELELHLPLRSCAPTEASAASAEASAAPASSASSTPA